tara:strand:+ start:85 stop:489 length:405 start_codon:yes stop_codon:yes gene_type:complete
MSMIRRNEANKPTLMGVPVPDMVTTSKLSKAAGLDTKDLGAAAFGLGVTLAGLKGIKDTRPKKNLKKGRRTKKKEALKAKYSVKPPVSKPKFSNIAVPVGKPKQTRKAQTLKDEKGRNPVPGRKGSRVTGSKLD